MQEGHDLNRLSDSDLTKVFDDHLQEYGRWIDKEIEPNDGWVEELEYMSFIRGEIHNIVVEMQKRHLEFNSSLLSKHDSDWQSWLEAKHGKGFRLEHPREAATKNQWWEWIDQLNKLSPEERTTL